MKIIIDAFGGDHAPVEIVKGAITSVNLLNDVEIVLTGAKDRIQEVLNDTFVKTRLTLNYNEIGEFTKNIGFLESYSLSYTDDKVFADVTVKKVYFNKFAKFKK